MLEQLRIKTKELDEMVDKSPELIKTGEAIDALFLTRGVLSELSSVVKEANSIKAKIEALIIAKMEDEGITRSESRLGSVSVSGAMYPSVVDTEAFTRWVVSENRFDMLQKRCSPASVVEYFELNNLLPDGIETYNKIKLNVRTKPSKGGK